MHSAFIKPQYGPGGFASLPIDILANFSGAKPWPKFDNGYDNIILCLADGFGWRHVERFSEHPVFQRAIKNGHVARLTSQFPSTTSGHITCIHTGLNVGQSGVFEWNYYEPILDAMIVPLLFSYSGTAERDRLKASGVNPQKLYPTETIYQKLNTLGVHSTIFQHREYTPSTYSNIVFSGATAQGYKSLAEAFTNLAQAVNTATGKNYFFLYYAQIDTASHEYGPGSRQAQAEIDTFLHVVEKQFLKNVTPGKKTLYLLTADHGQVEVDPSTTTYLNRTVPAIEKYIRTNKKGKLLVPGGSCRDMFMYIKDEYFEDARDILAASLSGKADVVPTSELIEQGYFGQQVSDVFRARVGNLVILPYEYESVWWYEKGRFEQNYHGHHGGLTPKEMEIPLLGFEL